MKFETRCVHVGVNKDSQYNSVITPIYPTSTFYWKDVETNSGYDYTRSGNPTRTALEENIAALENGVSCRATSTGMSAITNVLHLFKPGDHLIASNDIYGGTFRLFHNVFTELGYDFSYVDQSNIDNVRDAIRPETRGIWIETPSNPLLKLTDIGAIVEISKQRNIVTIADNTFLSPYFQRPLDLGVDVVMHSTTKYLNGHSDVVGGCVVSREEEMADRVGYLHNALGLACAPFDAWLVLRGIKTLGPRMEAHQRNAQAIAEFLAEHPAVTQVNYPGLPTHPQHELAKQQQHGFGGMLSFEVAGGRAAVERVMAKTKYFHLAESLGGVESLIEYPLTMSHASMTPEARAEAGISKGLIRVSAGIENTEDLVADLGEALAE